MLLYQRTGLIIPYKAQQITKCVMRKCAHTKLRSGNTGGHYTGTDGQAATTMPTTTITAA